MRLIFIAILLSLSTFTFAESLYNYKIVKIIDGDTVNIEVDFLPKELGNHIGLRILGIDTPELRGKCIEEIQKAKDAKKFLSELIKNNQYSVMIKGRDKYFRILGDIKIKDTYVSMIMINKGYARFYEGKTKQSWCKG